MKISKYPGPDNHNRNKIKVELDLSNYGTKFSNANVAAVHTSKLAEKLIYPV